MHETTPLVQMLPIGALPDDPLLDPGIGHDGSIALEPGEDSLYWGAHQVEGARASAGKMAYVPGLSGAGP